jgi:hypothetical protein
MCIHQCVLVSLGVGASDATRDCRWLQVVKVKALDRNPSAASTSSGTPMSTTAVPNAAAAMEALLTRLQSAHVQHAMKDSSGAAIHELAVVPRRTRGGYIAAHTSNDGGVLLSLSTDLVQFDQVGAYHPGGKTHASAPALAAVTGRGPSGIVHAISTARGFPASTSDSWWVLAFETRANGIGFALFESEAALLGGNASRTFLAPNAPLKPASGKPPVPPAGYSSPTIYSAVFSQRAGRLPNSCCQCCSRQQHVLFVADTVGSQPWAGKLLSSTTAAFLHAMRRSHVDSDITIAHADHFEGVVAIADSMVKPQT